MPSLEFDVEKDPDAPLARLNCRGKIEGDGAKNLDSALNNLLDEGTRVVVLDFFGVDYITSAGLEVMIRMTRTFKEWNSRIALIRSQGAVRNVFRMVGSYTLFGVVETHDDLIEVLREHDVLEFSLDVSFGV